MTTIVEFCNHAWKFPPHPHEHLCRLPPGHDRKAGPDAKRHICACGADDGEPQ